MQATAVKKEGVLAKQLIELSHSRMVVARGWASNWLKVRSTNSEDIFITKLLSLALALATRQRGLKNP
jgi:hypothetical protein